MGGRGASSGTRYYHNGQRWLSYGDEFESIHVAGNIKFVENKIDANTKAPKETRTQGRIYVTVNKKEDVPQYITYYDKKGKKFKQLDINQHYRHKKPTKDGIEVLDKKHRHFGYEHNEKGDGNLSTRERRMVASVLWEWRKYKRNNRK